MQKMLAMFLVIFLVFAFVSYAGNAVGTTYVTQISPTAKTVLTTGAGSIVSVWASQDITTATSDMYIVDAGNTWTARTEENTLLKIVFDAGDTGNLLIYKGAMYGSEGWRKSKYTGIGYTNGVRVESATTTGNAYISIRTD